MTGDDRISAGATAGARAAETDANRANAAPDGSALGVGRRLRLAARVVQVRLRFVAVLIAAFLVVGLWGNLRNYWDTMIHRLAGSPHIEHAVSDDTEYFCPMDPGVVSDWPAICPVCNMDLVRRKKGEAAILPEGVVARMQFSPYRIQLAGIKTSVVSRKPLVREIILAGRLVASAPAATVQSGEPESAISTTPMASLALECEAYAGDVRLLPPGRRAEVSVEELPGLKPLAAVIEESTGQPTGRGPSRAVVRIRLETARQWLRPGMYCTARIAVPLSEFADYAARSSASEEGAAAGFLAVPETAVVDTGNRRVVFVETMPGMFDGVEVTLGPRCGDDFAVLAGLEPGQKVATVGAFLIDAEARLNPNLAAGYFGAARTAAGGGPLAGAAASPPAAVKPAKEKKVGPTKLSAADRQLVKKQKKCPVTGLPLDSMGGPIAVDVEGQRVFLCCRGCESKLKQDPRKYLSKLKAQ